MSLIDHLISAKQPTPAGKGRLSIAFLDTGISPVADFILPENRIAAFRDFVNGKKEPYDDNGHGTHVPEPKKSSGSSGRLRVPTKSSPFVEIRISTSEDSGRNRRVPSAKTP